MQELVTSHKIDYKTNLDEVKASIVKETEKYDVVIDSTKLPEAKKMMAELNTKKAEFNSQCKIFIDIVSEPIVHFKKQQKEITELFDESRSKIKSQVDKYEAGRLIEIKDKIQDYINFECDRRGINLDLIPVEPFVMLTALTKNGAVSSATKAKIEGRIVPIENQILQEKIKAQEAERLRMEQEETARINAEEKANRDKEIAVQKARDEEKRIADERVEAEAQKLANEKLAELKKESDKIKAETPIPKAKEPALKPIGNAQTYKQPEPKGLDSIPNIIEKAKPAEQSDMKTLVFTATFEIEVPFRANASKVKDGLETRLKEQFQSFTGLSLT